MTLERSNTFGPVVGDNSSSLTPARDPGCIVIVDPFSTGAHLASEVMMMMMMSVIGMMIMMMMVMMMMVMMMTMMMIMVMMMMMLMMYDDDDDVGDKDDDYDVDDDNGDDDDVRMIRMMMMISVNNMDVSVICLFHDHDHHHLSIHQVCKAGLKCCQVLSIWDSPVASLVQQGLNIDFCATIQFNDRLPYDQAFYVVLQALKELPFPILAVIPGAETGIVYDDDDSYDWH